MTINIQQPNQDARDSWMRLKEKLGITPPKPVGPTYLSASKGLIKISSMHYNHRLSAARKMLLAVVEDIKADIETLSQLEELQDYVVNLPMEDGERETLRHLTNIHVDQTITTTTAIPTPKLLNVYDTLLRL